jgi:ABC transporter substrate binding protein
MAHDSLGEVRRLIIPSSRRGLRPRRCQTLAALRRHSLRAVSLLVLGLGLLAAPLTAQSQPPEKTARVGVLAPGPSAPGAETYNAFRQGLSERGWIEGRNLILDFRYADNRYDRLPTLAAELVALKPDVIFAVAAPAIRAVAQTTSTIPIVIETLGDAPSAGLVPDLARPGGNITGVSGFAPELVAKRLQLLREILPKADNIGVLANLANPTSPPVVRATETAARQLQLQLHVGDVREAKSWPVRSPNCAAKGQTPSWWCRIRCSTISGDRSSSSRSATACRPSMSNASLRMAGDCCPTALADSIDSSALPCMLTAYFGARSRPSFLSSDRRSSSWSSI